ncbi:MAG: hypothetical protein HRT97_04320 [Moritella sp.]|uniref:hypothetical protein n=1 Tax=Moritella sp. TaxID=78556 RepID=UPI0025F99509|nr:hypothetical protein [Moritella sp.]NQZ91551.1 hypothetical protein [Moritella sp.]
MSSEKIKKSAVNDAVVRGVGSINQAQTAVLDEALKAYGETLKQTITKKCGEITNQTLAVQQGFLAEGHHAASFNINAASKGVDNVHASMDSISAIDPVVDIRISESNGSFTDAQVKFYKDGSASAKAISDQKYNGVGKVVPKDQLSDAQSAAGRQAARNQQTRPEVSNNYQNTADKVDDSIRSSTNPNIKSDSIARKGEGGTEDLTNKIKNGEKVKYGKKAEVQSELQSVQYGNALKAGSIAGLVSSSASELIRVMRSDKPLTREECEEVAINIVLGTASGATKALLTTGLQHAGKHLAENASKEILKSAGKTLLKGNVAANVALMAAELGKGLFQYGRGDIDGIEFAENMTSAGLNIAAGAAGYAAGVAMAPVVGTMITTSVSSAAVAGTTLGALGPVGLGIAVSIASTMAVSAYCGHFSSKGMKIAHQDFKRDMELLNAGEINLAAYTGRVSTMSELKFSWSDILPLSGTFSVWGEYKARKGQLQAIQSEMHQRMHKLDAAEANAMYQVQADYMQKFAEIELQYKEMLSGINQQVDEKLGQFDRDLDTYLQLKFAISQSSGAEVFRELANKKNALQTIEREKSQITFYREELNELTVQLSESISTDDQEFRSTMVAVIKSRINDILPKVTPYDKAFNFMNPDLFIETMV